ncbi:unnamed protein product [Kuraishia capsulata CBS 1993]|uniref:Zn(2)-C6 fungal-type domain-containing protein n=1 Tax=Kuraishia capsulata CBS 1993 TaxID=1382522 RepID=W6MNS2_9ASCO|nr:uncharacterized protein KUCA_T00004301001 [Kuraishia capsulata CBS 1993]CDK28319.1 unnamed protein product [Kuraishia capsulata CBS 1993]
MALRQGTSPPLDTPSGSRDCDKKGRSTSCYFCQKRKQKCDHQLPSCSTCLKAGVKCEQPEKYGMTSNSNVLMLEKKICHLQKLLEQKASMGVPLPKYTMVPVTCPHSAASPPIDGLHVDEKDYRRSILGNYQLQDFLEVPPINNIDPKTAKQLLEIYFALFQYKFPLLVERDVLEFHRAYFANEIDNYDDFHFSCARMWLIFSISALLHMTTGKYKGPSPAGFFSTALRHASKLRNITPLQKVEILILLVFYLIRTDKDSFFLFDVVSEAMRQCKALALHRRQGYENMDPDLRDRRMRCFWCTYLLEKAIASSVGKPYVLLESQMDQDIPMFDHEPSKANSTKSGTIFVNEAIKIRRIEAKFVEELDLNNPESNATKHQLPKVRCYFADLENWRQECQGFGTKGIENETLSVYYCRSIRTLIQPFLELLDPEDRLFKECQAAAGQICQSLKSFHQRTVTGHSIVHIHTMFVAGVTLIYCLWLTRNVDDHRRRQLGDDSKHTRPTVSEALFRGLDDLRSCSVCLYVMAERTSYAISFRDTFDDLLHATMANLILRCGPDSSEIIYNSSPGLPPAVVRKPLTNYALNIKLNMRTTEAEKKEEEDLRKKQGQLKKLSIPKGLNHLLAHPPPFGPDDDLKERAKSTSQLRSTLPETRQEPRPVAQQTAHQPAHQPAPFSAEVLLQPELPSTATSTANHSPSVPLTSYSYSTPGIEDSWSPESSFGARPTQNHRVSGANTFKKRKLSDSSLERIQDVGFQNNQVDLSSLVGRTHEMINNISTWTGESGQQFPNIVNNLAPIELPEMRKANLELMVPFTDVQTEDFWSGWEDFGFLP